MTGITERNFKYVTKPTFILLYNSMVRSHLHYWSFVWDYIDKKASIRWQDSARRQFQAGLRGDVGL